jgi:hypothetical protein
MTKRNHIVNLAAAEIKTRKKKESNIVIVGLKESTNLSDEELVNEFFDAIEVSKDEILHVRRYKKREKTQNSSQQGDQNTTERVGVIQVVLKSAITQHEALRRGNYHNIEGFERVYTREDRTPAEQEAINKLFNEKKRKNEELIKAKLDKPFRWIIHRLTGSVRCIDVEQSSNNKKCMWISKEQFKEIKSVIATSSNSNPNYAAMPATTSTTQA